MIDYDKHKNNDVFCPVPWVHVALRSDGNVTPCCKWSNTDQPIYEDYTYDPFGAFNSKNTLAFREQLEKGIKSIGCNQCYVNEEVGKESLRQRIIKIISSQTPSAREQIFASPQIRFLELNISNFCNLKCASCDVHQSNLWEKDEIELSKLGITRPGPNINTLKKFNTKDINLDKLIENHLSTDPSFTFFSIKILGGEPSIQPEVLTLLESCSKKDKLQFQTNTNAVIFPYKLIQIFKKLNKVDISLSIDGIEDYDRYLRYPSNWKSKLENIKKYMELASMYDNINIKFHCTVSILNIFHLEYYDSFLKKLFGENIVIFYSLLQRPEYLSIAYHKKVDIQAEEYVLNYMYSKQPNKQYINNFKIFKNYIENSRDIKPLEELDLRYAGMFD